MNLVLRKDHLDGQSGSGGALLPQPERCPSEGEEGGTVQVVGWLAHLGKPGHLLQVGQVWHQGKALQTAMLHRFEM